MNAFLTAAAIWLTPSLLIGAWILADRWLDGRHDAERPARPTADPEWIAGLYDHPPIFAEVERDMGPIFEAGYERQAKRGRELLEDRAAFDRWLYGGRSS